MVLAVLAGILAALLLGVGCLVLVSCLYLLTLAVACFLHQPATHTSKGTSLITVLVPAHNEEESLGRCLTSLTAQTYPRHRRRIVVVADNCTDRTADVAAVHGAEVMLRDDPDTPGKGRALRWALDELLTQPQPADVIVMVDADSVAEPDLLRHLEADLSMGAEVAQADYRVLESEASSGSRLAAAGFLLFHRVRMSGRAALRLPANLVGNGMAFRRDVLMRIPWSAFTSVEDLEYSIHLRLAGVRPVFSARAVVYGPMPNERQAIRRQRIRWEGGRLFLLSTWIGPLMAHSFRRRDWALLDAALDLAILPTGLLALAIGLGLAAVSLAVIEHLVPAFIALPWLGSVIVLPSYVFIGLRAAGAPPSAYRAMLSVPKFLAGKVRLYARLLAGVDPARWETTDVDGNTDRLHDPDGDGRAWIAGIPVDVVDMDGAVDRVMDLIGRQEGGQVCTVNLDFVVSAQNDPDVTALLRRSDLNLADGAPITWLARLLGHRMPRVAGADLVPLIAGAAAGRGMPIFFLGGEKRAAEESAARLRTKHPSLVVAGCYEPPRAPVEGLPSPEMVALIRQSGAAIVLVGLGHPKQEKWIAQNRAGLGTSVAIGVGGCFDFIAERRRRAPRWAQKSGLEWLFRLSQEPRRLFMRYARDGCWLVVLTPRVFRSRRQVPPGLESARA